MTGLAPLSTLLLDGPEDGWPLAMEHGAVRRWGDFRLDVARLSARLSRSRGRRWVVVSDDAYAFAVGFFAALHAGGEVVVPASHQPGFLRDLATQADGLLVHGEAGGEAAALPILGHSGPASLPTLSAINADEAVVVLHTSGSTGAPRAFARPLRCLEAEIATLETLFGGRQPESVLATVPPRHIYGLLFRVLWPLAAGRAFATGLVGFPEDLPRAVREVGPAILVSTPAFLTRSSSVIENRLPRLSLRVFSSGGPLASEVAARYKELLGEPVIEVYGSTECGGIGYRTTFDAAGGDMPWTPMPGVHLRLDPRNCLLSINSPHAPGGTWVLTGDRARLLADGRFELLGRADRIAKVEQVRVSLSELERRLLMSPLVADARVISLAGPGRESLAAVVVLSAAGWSRLAVAGKHVLKHDLLKLLRPYVEAVALPRRWRFVRRLPETPLGKAAVPALADMFAEGEARPILPRVTEREHAENVLHLRLRVPRDLFYFNGHFRYTPVLPGVVQIEWAIRYAAQRFPVASVHRLRNLKFMGVLRPDDEVTLHLRYDEAKNRLHFRYADGDRDYSSGQIAFGAASP